jgi:hypothetical protein
VSKEPSDTVERVGFTSSLVSMVRSAIFADKVEYALVDRLGAPKCGERRQLKERIEGARTCHSFLSRPRGRTASVKAD